MLRPRLLSVGAVSFGLEPRASTAPATSLLTARPNPGAAPRSGDACKPMDRRRDPGWRRTGAQDSSHLGLPERQLAWQKLLWRPSAQPYGRHGQQTRGAARF